ncbi:hypothetical protein PMIN06_011997 [Paraphaeosphaeria minitans]
MHLQAGLLQAPPSHCAAAVPPQFLPLDCCFDEGISICTPDSPMALALEDAAKPNTLMEGLGPAKDSYLGTLPLHNIPTTLLVALLPRPRRQPWNSCLTQGLYVRLATTGRLEQMTWPSHAAFGLQKPVHRRIADASICRNVEMLG